MGGGGDEQFGVLIQSDDVVSHLLQADLSMKILFGQQRYFAHWTQGRHHAFPFGYVDSNSVHIVPPV